MCAIQGIKLRGIVEDTESKLAVEISKYAWDLGNQIFNEQHIQSVPEMNHTSVEFLVDIFNNGNKKGLDLLAGSKSSAERELIVDAIRSNVYSSIPSNLYSTEMLTASFNRDDLMMQAYNPVLEVVRNNEDGLGVLLINSTDKGGGSANLSWNSRMLNLTISGRCISPADLWLGSKAECHLRIFSELEDGERRLLLETEGQSDYNPDWGGGNNRYN